MITLRSSTIWQLLLALCMLIVATAVQGQTYRWFDDKGNVHYGNQVPPEFVDNGYEVINSQGIVVKRVESAPSPEEQAERKRQAEERAAQRQEAKRQAARDQTLLDTFASPQDIIETRDRRLATIQGLIDIAQRKARRLQSKLDELTAQAAALERQGKPIDQDLQDDIQRQEHRLQEQQDYIASQKQRQRKIKEKFNTDLRRYRELKAAQN